MAVTPVVEPGRCDPAFCNDPNSTSQFVSCQGPTCTQGATGCTFPNYVNNCVVGPCNTVAKGPMTIPASVPIKQLLKGTGASPWVRIRFQGCVDTDPNCHPSDWDYTEITTGNISQPYYNDPQHGICRAVIKSFQYGWGGINSGNVCKVVIHDEEGSSFAAWFKRLSRNPQGASLPTGRGVYKMKVTFGWLITGGDANCPAQVTSQPNAACADQMQPDGTFSNNPQELICSPPIWFLPTNIICNLQQGKFVYELEGVDLLMQAGQTPIKAAFGGERVAGQNPQALRTHFVDACVKLGRISSPPFNVAFYQLDEASNDPANANPKRLQFFVQPNQANVSHGHLVNETVDGSGVPTNNFTVINNIQCPPGNWMGDNIGCRAGPATPEDLRWRGPLGVWDTRGLNPLAAIQSWMAGVLANSTQPGSNTTGIGLTMNYDPITEVDPANFDPSHPDKGRLIIWANANPNCINDNRAFGNRLKALYVVNGGKCSPVFSFTPNIKWNFTAAMSAGGGMGTTSGRVVPARTNLDRTRCAIWGEAPRYEGSTPNPVRNMGGSETDTIVSVAQHLRANYLHNSIEAELKVQGDPSLYYCSPINGYGRTIALVVVNPFFMDQDTSADCPKWSQLVGGSCNEILSSRNWFIKGVEHQIKEGSYTTSIKLMLFNPGSELPGRADGSTASSLRETATMPWGEDEQQRAALFGAGTAKPMQLGGDPLGSLTFFCEQGTWTCLDKNVEGGEDITNGTNTFCEHVCSGDYEVK